MQANISKFGLPDDSSPSHVPTEVVISLRSFSFVRRAERMVDNIDSLVALVNTIFRTIFRGALRSEPKA